APVAGHRRIRPPAGTAAPPTARRRGRRGAAMSVPRAEPGGSTPTPSPGPRRTHGRSPGGASPARASAAESLALVSSVASRSCRWGPSSARAPYRARLATDERSRSESAITIPGTGDHDAPESVIRIDRKERSRSAGTSDQDASEPAHSLPFRSADHAAQDSNLDPISVPAVSQFSQQRLTSIGHYESAWRTENTGSNPVGDSNPCFWRRARRRALSKSSESRRSAVASTIQSGPPQPSNVAKPKGPSDSAPLVFFDGLGLDTQDSEERLK